MHRIAGKMVVWTAAALTVGCGATDKPDAVTSTVTSVSTKTVAVTPKHLPNLECRPPVVDFFKVQWDRRFGPGIPPQPKENEPQGFNYFASYAPKRAEVRLLNLSPHRIYTRGINFQVSWMAPEGEILSSRYLYSLPANSTADTDFGAVPAEPPSVMEERDAEWVNGGDTIDFTRNYSGEWEARVAGGNEPNVWVEPQEIDWWFADKNVRQRCGQVHE